MSWDEDVVAPVEKLLEEWQREGNHAAVEVVLPAWRTNSGLTDGWAAAAAALRDGLASGAVSRAADRRTLERVARRIERAVRRR
ncbi:MAG: hypothetical protein M3N21_02755 [Actinomycetota bacterium]|nr:hypothetical protein [Actinomycetota bacterium]